MSQSIEKITMSLATGEEIPIVNENMVLFPANPIKYGGEHVDPLLIFATHLKASDIFFKTNDYIRTKINGKLYRLSSRRLGSDEFNTLVSKIYGAPTVLSKLNAAEPVDLSYIIRRDDFTMRFRVSMLGASAKDGDGYKIVIRTISDTPPDLDKEIPEEIIDCFNISGGGLILIVGATGSGKSTLIASIIKNKLLNPNIHVHIISYEAPIEYSFDKVPQKQSFIDQVEVPRHVNSFKVAVENALRSAPDDIFVGEMRDTATIKSGIDVCKMGHLVYSTMHVNGVSDTIKRITSIFGSDERRSVIADLISTLRLIVYQKLLKTVDGKRTAVREYLVFNEDIKTKLLENDDLDNVSHVLEQLLWENGFPFIIHARQRFLEGKISATDYKTVRFDKQTTKTDEELDAIIKKHKDAGHVMFQKNNL